ncbi:hypothetical protein R1sor_012986 [Riccia sorocarpa]|uniref:Uncharacterized protein n=1 Tax=Riccia sorocarpa TaxID=122646 RepID=A0ABD3I5B9_9MARC
MNEGLTDNSAVNVDNGNGADSFDDQLRGAFVHTCRERDFLRGVNLGEDVSLSSYVEDSFPELGPRASGDPGVEPGSAPLVNAEQGSMGAGAGAAAAIENEPSPRRAAIEKAQAELRREVAVRDERRRELEFLEKGGELLEFFSAGDFALPPSSPTDPLADQLLSSEGEGGYASIASANGNSVENSVGTSFCLGRNSEGGGDFYAGEDVVNAVIEPLASWEGKGRASRTGSTSLRSSNDLKRESEGSGGGRAVGKSQAYSRRNRPRSNRFGNGHPPTKDADNAVGHAAVNEVRETFVPPVVPQEVTEENESAVDKNSHMLPASGQLNYSSTQAEPVSTKVKEDIDVSPTPPGKSPEQTPVSQVSTVDDVAETGKNYQGYELAPGSFRTLSHKNDQEAHVCRETVLKDQVGLVGDVEKVPETSLSPRTERNVDFKEVGDVSDPSDQLLGKNQAAPDKACALPTVVMDESTIVMVKDESLGSQTSKSDCKDKPTILAESKGDRVVDRNTVIPKHVPDSTLTPTIDDKTSVLREVSCTVQLTPKNLDPSENKSNPSRKATPTASSGAQDQSQSDKAVVCDRLPVAQVAVKVEEGLSQVGTRLSVVDTQVESGHDVKNIYLVSLPQEEIKTESQSTPVSAGSNRTGFRTPSSNTASINKFPGVVLPWEKERDPNVRAEAERHKADLSAKARKAHEDYILEEAEIIKNTSKETAEWAKRSPFPELTRRKSHWEYVLQEMAWMANDFMQERLWKLAAASQFSRWIAQQRSQSDFQKAEIKRRQKRVARVLANAVNEFWRLVESKMYRENSMAVTSLQSQRHDISGPQKDENEAVPMDVDMPATGEGLPKELEKQGLMTRKSLPVQGYAFRFLRDAVGNNMATQAEAPSTPERMSEASSVLDTLWEDLFPEQPAFYTVPEGAFQAYRTLVETERTALEIEHAQNIKEHVAALAEAEAQAMADGAASSEFNGSLPVDECQPLTFLSQQMKGLRGENEEHREQYIPNAISSIAKKKRKNILKSGATKSEGLPSPAVPQRPPTVLALDTTGVLPSPLVTGKRSVTVGPGNVAGNIGSIPTKRMRSAPTGRQRVLGTASPSAFPSPAGAPPKTTFPGGALNQEEARNAGDETVIPRSEADVTPPGVKNGLGSGGANSSVSSKSKKKKKTKHFSGTLGTSLKGEGTVSVNTSSSLKPSESEHRSVFDQLKRKGDHNHTSSVEPDTGGIGSSADTAETPNSQGQPPAKKLKVSKQPGELNVESAATTATQAGSMAANTSSTSKLLRQNSNRDRNRKTKSAKVPISQPSGVGVPWTTIEDQAIFALVHDLGHNWELVSDVLSSSSQLKGIFRKPKQCKERYKSLMDRMAVGGEGGDSPEDPSTSQPHPASLPGIPKGAARMVLQRIQGPMEEDTLKVHLENIVRVAQKFRALKPQIEEQKALVQPHASHLNVVAQICPNGYPTPLDLCEITAATPELGGPTYQMSGSHISGVMPPVSGMRPSSNGIPVLPGNNSLHMGVPPAPPTSTAATAARDVHRLAAIRPFSPEDAQRVRYQRAVAAARGLPVGGATSTAGLAMMGLPGSSDCPVPLLGPGNNVAMMGGMGRGMSLSRPGLPGMGSPGVSGISPPPLGTVLPSGGVGIVSSGPAVGQTGVPQQVNLMRRSRESPLVRARSSEEQRRLIEELKLQAAQGNTQAASALSNLGSEMTREMLAVQGQQLQQLQHQSQQQQQYLAAARMAKERQQMQQKQRMLQQQLQQPTALQPQMQSQMQQQQMHSMSQQHVLPQQSHLSQQQHLLSQQQHNMQKQQSQPGSQQSGTLSSPSLQPTAVPSMQSNHQAHQNLLPPQQQSSLGQVSQLPVQSKLQPPRQLQKNPNLRQPSQVVQQQQQPPRASKGVVRGNMLMQGLPASGPSVVPGSVPQGNHLQQAGGQQMSHPIQGSRHLMPLAKPISQTSSPVMTGQPGFMQAQQNQSMSGSVAQNSLPGQQKVVSQQQAQVGNLPAQQLQPSVSPNVLAGQQQQSPTASLPAQQQTSPPPQQSQIGSSQQMQQQQRRSAQTQMQSAQRRVQQRQPGVSVGGPMIGQLVKNGSPSQPGQVPAQLPQPGGTYAQGTNMAGPVSLGAGPGASGLPTSGSPSSAGVHSTAWKQGQQSVPPMTTGFYNLSRSGSPGSAQLPSGVSSSGIHLPASNGNSGISVSNSGPHGVNTGLSQPLQVGSSSHASKIGLIPGVSSRVVSPTLSTGSQRSAQHHGSLPTSSPVSPAPAGMMPVSALGAAVAGGVPSSGTMPYQPNSASAPSHSTSVTNAMHLYTVQPRQSHGSVAMATPAVPSKPPGASVISQTSASSASSPAAVISPSPTVSTSVAESTPP